MAQQQTHTPGPWSFEQAMCGDSPLDFITVIGPSPNYRGVCDIISRWNGERDKATEEADARLIAAAPALLKACQQAIYALKGREHDGFLREAIRLATGADHV